MTTASPFQQARDQYFTPRQPNECDVVFEVRSIMLNSGLAKHFIDIFDADQNVISALNKNAYTQRYILNRYWTIQLQSVKANSEHARFCLFPEGDIHEWLKTFQHVVIPFILENNLPVVLNG